MLRSAVALLLVAAIWGMPGCGGQANDSPERFPVSGTVTFRGEPVPVGSIQFSPDSSRGNSGPAGYAAIQNGKFDTSRDGKGTVGGPHTVVIIGLDGKGDPKSDLPQGNPLFPEFHTTIDLPASATVQDFEILKPEPAPGREPQEKKKG